MGKKILEDIEIRISELLSKQIVDTRQVVNENQIKDIISVMGQPEDYGDDVVKDDSENYSKRNKTEKKKNNRKLFRDGEDSILGGVCSGLSVYLGIEVIWMRLLFLVLGFAGVGSGVIAYFILWFIIPEAKTTSQKLQMNGEPVNIDNIEKKIREEFEKIKEYDYSGIRYRSRSFIERVVYGVLRVFKFLISGVFLFALGGTFIGLIIAILYILIMEAYGFNTEVVTDYPSYFYSSLPLLLVVVSFFVATIIPVVGLFYLVLKVFLSDLKRISLMTFFVLLSFWILAIFTLIFSGIDYNMARSSSGLSVEKNEIVMDSIQSLKIGFVSNKYLYFGKQKKKYNASSGVSYINGEQKVFSDLVYLDVRESHTDKAYVEVVKQSVGKNTIVANEKAAKLIYKYKFADSRLLLDSYFLRDVVNRNFSQRVFVNVYLPIGKEVYFEKSSGDFISMTNNPKGTYDSKMTLHHFKMTENGLVCLDCEDLEKEL